MDQAMPSPSVRWHQPTFWQSIRTRLLILLYSVTAISVLTISYLAINTVQSVAERAQQINVEASRAQAEEYLRQVAIDDAQQANLTLKQVQQEAGNVARYAAGIFESPDAFTGGAYWRAEDSLFTGPDGQYMNSQTDVSDVFVPNFVDMNGELLKVLDLSAYLDFVLVPTYENTPNTAAIYLGTEEEILRYYPNIHIGTVVPPDFRVTQRPWYVSAAPQANPARKDDWLVTSKGETIDFVTFARTEGRFAKQFDKNGQPSPELLKAQDDRLKNWRLLQELAGLR